MISRVKRWKKKKIPFDVDVWCDLEVNPFIIMRYEGKVYVIGEGKKGMDFKFHMRITSLQDRESLNEMVKLIEGLHKL